MCTRREISLILVPSGLVVLCIVEVDVGPVSFEINLKFLLLVNDSPQFVLLLMFINSLLSLNVHISATGTQFQLRYKRRSHSSKCVQVPAVV